MRHIVRKKMKPREPKVKGDIPCKNKDCREMAEVGQSYCSRDCAPFGWYGFRRAGKRGFEEGGRDL